MNDYFAQKQRKYSERLDKKTMEYQRKYGFELNPLKEHRTWNVEADAFMQAQLSLMFGKFVAESLINKKCNQSYYKWDTCY